MKIDLEFVELHQPLFLAGKNFGTKLDPTRQGGIKMWYDTELEHTIVIYQGKVALIENTASKTMYNPEQLGIKVEEKIATVNRLTPVPSSVKGPITAQVSTPATMTPKTIRRPAKYQGEVVEE